MSEIPDYFRLSGAVVQHCTDSHSQQGTSSLATSLFSAAHTPASLLRRASVSSCSSVSLGVSSLSAQLVPQLSAAASRVGDAVKQHACALVKEVIIRSTDRFLNVPTTHSFVPSAEELAAGNVEATISYRRMVQGHRTATSVHSVTMSFPRTATGHDILREFHARVGHKAVTLRCRTIKSLQIRDPLYKLVPLSDSTINLEAIDTDSCVSVCLRVKARNTGVDIKRKTNLETCIVNAGHPMLGAREKGSNEPFILFDLQMNSNNVFAGVHAFEVLEDDDIVTVRSLESEVLLNTSIVEVGEAARKVMKSFGKYRYLQNNCQRYISLLADELGIPGLAQRKWLLSRPFWQDDP